MTDYSRQMDLNIKVPSKIAVVGVGGTGSWIALFSAMSGVKHINLYDSDTVDHTNIARMIYSPSMVGKPKVECMAKIITTLRPECRVQSHSNIDNINIELLKCSDTVICCTDNIDSQRTIKKFCDKHALRFLRVGYDGLDITMTSKVSMWGQGGSGEGYQIAPSWVIPTAIAACIGMGQIARLPVVSERDSHGGYHDYHDRLFPQEMSGNLRSLRFSTITDEFEDEVYKPQITEEAITIIKEQLKIQGEHDEQEKQKEKQEGEEEGGEGDNDNDKGKGKRKGRREQPRTISISTTSAGGTTRRASV